MASKFSEFVFLFEKLPPQTKNDLKTLIEGAGASVQYMMNEKVTHLVAVQSELSNPNNFSIQKAKKKGIKLVTPQNVEDEAKRAGPKNIATSNLSSSKENAEDRLNVSNERLSSGASNALASYGSVSSLSPPTITLLLPSAGSNVGGYQVAVFGLNFAPGPAFRVKFGNTECVNYEFHAATSVIATLPTLKGVLANSEVLVAASNDGGRSYGFPIQFRFIDALSPQSVETDSAKLTLVASQLQNLNRALSHMQQMEQELRSQLNLVSNYKAKVREEGGALASGGNDADIGESSSTAKRDRFEREFKLFISSPFRDMQQERDVLVKLVIPKIRKLCMERDVLFSYVDLRWGVTGSQSEAAAMLLMCLREMENSDAMIGMYGERYGWHMSDERDTGENEQIQRTFEMAKKSFPWVERFKDRSVTEVEMRMVLDKLYKGPEKSAWFYMRDEYYVEEVPKNERVNFQSEGPKSKNKLQQLKLEIAQSPYSSRNYHRPDQIEELVFADIKELLDTKYPAGESLSATKKEEFRHMAYGRGLSRVYLPNEANNMLLDKAPILNISVERASYDSFKFVSGEETKPLLVGGVRGVGKSALLGNWVKRYIEHHPEDIVLAHYIGCSPTSASYSHMLWRVMSQVQESLGFAEQLPQPDDNEHIPRFFLKWIDKVVEATKKLKKKVIVVIDGFDKLDDRNNAMDLVWWPASFPPVIRVVLSAAPSHVYDVLAKRGCSKTEVGALNEGERKSLIRLHLNKISKKLEDKQEFIIAGAQQTSNPRFLLTLLDDIAVFGEHDDLEKKIATDLHAQNTAGLYEIVIERLERDCDKENKGFVSAFLVNVWAARRGLLVEEELTVIMANQGFQASEWATFFLLAQELLLSDVGSLVNFSNADVRTAVEMRYLKSDKQKFEAHKRVGAFFMAMEDTVAQRRVEELPYQLETSQQYKELEKTLVDLQMFSKLYTESHKFDLFRYWREVEKNAKIEVSDLIFDIGTFLQSMNKFAASEEMYQKSITYYVKASQRLQVAKVYQQLGDLFNLQRRYTECEEMLKQAEAIYKEEKGDDAAEIGVVMKQLGTLYVNRNKHTEALAALQTALQICETKLGSDHLTTSDVFYELGCSYLSQRDLAKAEQNLLRALRIKEVKQGDWDPEVSHILNRLGSMYIEQDNFKDAESCFTRALIIREAKLGPEHSRVAQTLRHLVSLYELLERYDEAIAACQRAAKITEKIFGGSSWEMSGVLFRLGSLTFVKCTAVLSLAEKDPSKKQAFKQMAIDYVTRARDIRVKLYGEDHAEVQECNHMLDEIIIGNKPTETAAAVPTGKFPPPPPPAPLVKKPVSAASGGIPPPPPPPGGLKAPPQQLGIPPPPPPAGIPAPKAPAKPPSGTQWTAELSNFSGGKLKKMAKKDAQKDGREAAIQMMGQGKAKIMLNALW